METKSLVLDLVDKSESINQIRKNIIKGELTRAFENVDLKYNDRLLIESVSFKSIRGESFDVLVSTDEVKIFKIKLTNDDWDIKYPFRLIVFKDGYWQRVSTVCDTLDSAFLIYLQFKHLGENSTGSSFSYFAMKMLGMEIPD